MMGSEDLRLSMPALYQAVALALVCVVTLATSAFAENTWVLWEESNEMHAFARTPANHARATYASAEDCIRAIDAEWEKLKAAWPAPDGGFSRLGPKSAVMMLRYGDTTRIVTYTCLPDTMRPPF